MNTNQDQQTTLPIKNGLALIYAVSFIIAILMATASAAGLLYRTTIYPTEELLRVFVSNDVVNLSIGYQSCLAQCG